MSEKDRADILARAIDELIRGAHSSPNVEDDDLRSLMRVAESRHKAGIEGRERASEHEAAVWQELTARLESPGEREADPDDHGQDNEVRDVIAARRKASEDIHEMAELHREEVWRRVQEKVINQRPRKRGIFSFLESRTDGDLPMRRTGWGHTGLVLSGDAETDSLLRAALRPTGATSTQQQIRERLRSDPARQYTRSPGPAASWPNPGFVLRAGAVAVLAVAAIVFGPAPITGLADSPAVAAAVRAAEYAGVAETDRSPPTPSDATAISGTDMSAADAAATLGLPIAAPASVMGLSLASQRLYEHGLTGTDSGMFGATYPGTDASVSLYEEAASGSDLAVPQGVAISTLVDGHEATYYAGAWVQADDGSLTWQTAGTQTIVFERDGVRFTVIYTGPAIEPAGFAAAARTIR